MTLAICKCQRCGHEWATHKERWEATYGGKKHLTNEGYPFQCPKCKSARWRIPKEKKK